jgi:hypothetical protein
MNDESRQNPGYRALIEYWHTASQHNRGHTAQETAMSNKTPYEIRLEVLQMAKDHLDATFKAQCDFASQMMTAMIAANKATVDELTALVPKAYSLDEVTKKAADLYAFVLKKD